MKKCANIERAVKKLFITKKEKTLYKALWRSSSRLRWYKLKNESKKKLLEKIINKKKFFFEKHLTSYLSQQEEVSKTNDINKNIYFFAKHSVENCCRIIDSY